MGIKKVLLVLAIILTLFVGINTAAALSSSILDAISGLPLSDQVLFIAKEVDRLKACRSMDNLREMPAREDLEVTATYWGQGTVKAALDYLDRAARGEEIDPCWRYTDPSKPSDPCDLPTQAEIDQTVSFLKNRYQSYLSAKERCGE